MKWYKDQKTIDLNNKFNMDGWRQRILVSIVRTLTPKSERREIC